VQYDRLDGGKMKTSPQQPSDDAPSEILPPEDTAAPASPSSAAISEEEIEALRQKAELAAVNWDKYLRLAADFENYKKRAVREREEVARREREQMVLKLLPMLDALERGLESAAAQAPSVVDGLRLVRNMFAQMLAEHGAEEIASIGQPFDPELHHALTQEHSDTAAEGVVLREMRKGYRLGNRVLRAADVVVSAGAKPN
jgi:molecular chaperone GrpE